MDEATANLDVEVDKYIHDLIRTKFLHCTIITIAHRLQHVLDCDRLLVLIDGIVAEMGTPDELSSRPGGYLSTLLSNDRSKTNSIACEAVL